MLAVNIDYSNPSLAETLARIGADIVFIDCEQGDTDFQTIPDLARAAHIAGKPAVVRIASPQPHVIERTLFRGVDGIVMPRLDTAEQVADVVETVRYCLPRDHGDKAIVVQIESARAVAELDQILMVSGVHCLFIGPVDLAKSMGHGGDHAHPDVAAVIADVSARITAAGRSLGLLVDATTFERAAALGANFLYLHCNDFLKLGASHFVAMRDRQAAHLASGDATDHTTSNAGKQP